jgi:hypothetical protein
MADSITLEVGICASDVRTGRGIDFPFSYHYPWELTSLEDFTPCDLKRDLLDILREVIRAGFSRAAVLNALCAGHAIEITQLLYPGVAGSLRVLEFDVTRPTPLYPQATA